jgi:asparagine synthase (glutamine-hydrolysing)
MLAYAASWPGTYLLRRGLHMPDDLTAILDTDVVREGWRRLQPLSRLAASMRPDPGNDVSRIATLEASNYMRNQLLRDSDWAGMAHGLEIRVPLVDTVLLGKMASTVPLLGAGAGKRLLSEAPSKQLPNDVASRAKTGFGVPTNFFVPARVAGGGPSSPRKQSKGNAARQWAEIVIDTCYDHSRSRDDSQIRTAIA